MQNSKLPFLLLFLGLAILSYQFLVHPTAQQQVFARKFHVGLGGLAEDKSDSDYEPTTRTFAKPHHTQVAGLTRYPAPPPAPLPVAPPLTTKPLDMKALAKATDDKAKADTKKKKKKKKTVSPNPDPNANAQARAQAPAAPATTAADIPPAPVAPPPAQQNPETTSTNPAGGGVTAQNNNLIQYYENLLLASANSTATQKFVAAYKANQLSADVFYTVVAAMMASSNAQIKDLAVYAYGQVINIKSFEALVAVIDTDTSSDAIHTDALKYLTTYSDVTTNGTIAVLGAALTAKLTTPSLHIEALKLLDTAEKQYAQLETGATTGNGQITAQTYSPANAQKTFLSIESTLVSLAQSSTDASTKSQATQDLTDLQSVIGSQSASINP